MLSNDQRQLVENLRTAQSRIYHGDVNWYVTNASGWVIRGPYETREEAREQLKDIQETAWAEDEDAA